MTETELLMKQSMKLIDAYYQYLPDYFKIEISQLTKKKYPKIMITCIFEYALVEERLIKMSHSFLTKDQLQNFIKDSELTIEDIQDKLDKKVIKPGEKMTDHPAAFWRMIRELNYYFFGILPDYK